MAQQTRILFVDDIDGGEAAGTVHFGFDGVSYEIDLSKTHADEFADAIGPYVQVARRISRPRRRGPSASSGRHDQSAVRTWAREQGLKVSGRGRIPADIVEKYEAAH